MAIGFSGRRESRTLGEWFLHAPRPTKQALGSGTTINSVLRYLAWAGPRIAVGWYDLGGPVPLIPDVAGKPPRAVC